MTVFSNLSLGAKVVIDYAKKIGKVNLKTNLSAFNSYESSDLSNWTWTTSLSYTFWKGIGVGLDTGLRNNKQETLNFVRNLSPTPDETATFETIDNKLQTFFRLGLSYSF